MCEYGGEDEGQQGCARAAQTSFEMSKRTHLTLKLEELLLPHVLLHLLLLLRLVRVEAHPPGLHRLLRRRVHVDQGVGPAHRTSRALGVRN